MTVRLTSIFSPRMSLITYEIARYISSHPELSYQVIGDRYGLSRQRIGSIAKRFNMRRK